MIYIFDTCALIDLFRYYYRERFPSLWARFDSLVDEHRVVSVREVKRELDGTADSLSQWVSQHDDLFTLPTPAELGYVRDVFQVPHFQSLVRKKQQLEGKPVADPFVVAKARFVHDGCVVTQEVCRDGAARVPNVCQRFAIRCVNLEGFMSLEDWRF